MRLDVAQSYLSKIKLHDNHLKTEVNSGNLLDATAELHGELYEKCLSKGITSNYLASLSSKELHQLYVSLYTISFYTNKSEIIERVLHVLKEKIKREEHVDNLIIKLHGLYIGARQFEHASQLVKQHPDILFPLTPKIIIDNTNNKQRTLLEFRGGAELVRENYDIANKKQIIVVTNPLCNPSKRFKKWLDENKNINNIFKNQSTWVVPVSSRLYLKEVAEDTSLNIIFNSNEWPEITYWGTPTFYFYDKGKLQGQLVGWPQQTNETKLIEKLKQLGFM